MTCPSHPSLSRKEHMRHHYGLREFLRSMEGTLEGEMLAQALKTAERSDLKLFRTGAVIIDRNERIVARGCSHRTLSAATHAEENALRRTRDGHEIFIATLTEGGNHSTCSRPCASCARRLYNAGIERAHWYERCNDGSWEIRSVDVDDLYEAARAVPLRDYAVLMRVSV